MIRWFTLDNRGQNGVVSLNINNSMTLEDLILKYRNEGYQFWKFTDKDGKEIKIHFLFDTHQDYLNKYLGFYKTLPNFTELIVHATDGIFKLTNQGFEYFIRHNHQEVFIDNKGNQRGIMYEITEQVRNKLIIRLNDLLKARTFEEIHNIVSESKVSGFGELAIYDTAMRIASHMNIEPDVIYIHAGSRKGVEILEEKGYMRLGISNQKYIQISDMPTALQVFNASETEHFLCSMKDHMKILNDAETKLLN